MQTHNRRATNASNLCASAASADTYDYYMGRLPSLEFVTSSGNYSTAASDKVYGWAADDCTASRAFVCKIPWTGFDCRPPPRSGWPPAAASGIVAGWKLPTEQRPS
jgi:hypothetical protein